RARGILLEADRAPGFGEPQAIAGRDTPAEPRPAPELRDLPRHEKAVLGIGDRALDEIAPGQAAEAAVDLAQTREHARRGDRSVPDIVHLAFDEVAEAILGGPDVDLLPLVGPRAATDAAVEIDAERDGSLAVARATEIHRRASEAADARAMRVDDPLDESRGHRRIGCVAAGLEDRSTFVRRLDLRRSYHAVFETPTVSAHGAGLYERIRDARQSRHGAEPFRREEEGGIHRGGRRGRKE